MASGGKRQNAGRKPAPPELRRVKCYVRMLPAEIAKMDADAALLGMKRGEYVEFLRMLATPDRP